MSTDAAILVGGAGRRMGGVVKPLLPYRGVPMLDRQLQVLGPRFARIVLCTSSPEAFVDYDLPTVPDAVMGAGPIAGLVAALSWSDATHVFLFAGDMPRLSGPIVDVFLERARVNPEADVIAVRAHGRIEPLHAVYRTDTVDFWTNQLRQEKRSPRRILEEGSGVNVDWIDEESLRQFDADLRFILNVNQPAELS